MLVIVKQAPRDSALVRSILGDAYEWDLHNQVLAAIADSLRIANWQRAGAPKSEKPQPIPRPGVEPVRHVGGEAVSIEEMQERLARRRLHAVPEIPQSASGS